MDRLFPPQKLKNSPLVMVLAQLRFSPILSMEKYIPDIQETLRATYPRFTQNNIQAIRLGPEPQFEPDVHWVFLNKDQSTSITLATTFVSLSTNCYDTFEVFAEEFESMLESLVPVDISLQERLGLRYVDLVQLKKSETFSKYFQESLLGLTGQEFGAKGPLNRFEFVGRTDYGKIVIKCTEKADGTYLPPDLENNRLAYEDGKFSVSEEEVVRLLDFDHYSEESKEYQIADTIAELENLHKNCDAAFRKAVTPYALKQWGAEEISE
jgi:uncharacterized protein (TIGR04255 family)